MPPITPITVPNCGAEQVSNPFRRAYFSFGYLPLLLVLDQYERLEYYITCNLIKQTLDEVLKGENCPTVYGDEALEATKRDFKTRGWADQLDNYLHNVPNYAVECRKFIQQHYTSYRF